MGVQMWHPGTGGTFEAPDDAVAHYRQGGWLRLDERGEHEARAAERAAAERAAAEEQAASKKGAAKGAATAAGDEEK